MPKARVQDSLSLSLPLSLFLSLGKSILLQQLCCLGGPHWGRWWCCVCIAYAGGFDGQLMWTRSTRRTIWLQATTATSRPRNSLCNSRLRSECDKTDMAAGCECLREQMRGGRGRREMVGRDRKRESREVKQKEPLLIKIFGLRGNNASNTPTIP